MDILFCLCLLIAIWMTALIVVRIIYKQNLDFQLIIFAISWTAIITHIMGIW